MIQIVICTENAKWKPLILSFIWDQISTVSNEYEFYNLE